MRAENISVSFGKRVVVDRVSLSIPPGELLALVGPNGAGKSTLLSALAGEHKPDSGKVFLANREITSYSARELSRQRSVLTQDNGVSFPFRVAEVIEMGRNPWARTPEQENDAAVIDKAVQLADISHLVDRRFTALSGGERARVSLARVLAQNTPIVFLDEPTASLDLRHQEEVLKISRMLASENRVVVVVLHDLSLAGAYADRIALLAGGSLRTVGTPGEVLSEQLITEVYGIEVEVIDRDSRPMVIPRRK